MFALLACAHAPGGNGSGSPRVVFNVLHFGAAGDGAANDVFAFRSALAAARAAGGGEVYVPPGTFRLDGNLTVWPGVTLSGSYAAVPSHQLYTGQTLSDGSVLVPVGGRGGNGCAQGVDDLNCSAAFITITANAAVRRLVVHYAEQEAERAPVPYPWTFRLGGVYEAQYNTNAALMDVELLGSWNGVAATQAARHYIARVQGQPVNIGLFVDQVHDIGRIEDVHWVPWWSQAAPLIYHQTTVGRAFVFATTDWEYVLNTFAFAYSVGYHFIANGGPPGSGPNGNFVGIGADACSSRAVLVEQTKPTGISIVNGEFTAFCDRGMPLATHPHYFCPPRDPSVAPVQVEVRPGNLGRVQISDSSFWGPSHAIATVAGTGSVAFSGCHFEDWDNQLNATATGFVHNGTAAIQQRGSSLQVTGCEFKGAAAPQLALLTGARKTIFADNMIEGALAVVKAQGYGGKVVVRDNLDDS